MCDSFVLCASSLFISIHCANNVLHICKIYGFIASHNTAHANTQLIILAVFIIWVFSIKLLFLFNSMRIKLNIIFNLKMFKRSTISNTFDPLTNKASIDMESLSIDKERALISSLDPKTTCKSLRRIGNLNFFLNKD